MERVKIIVKALDDKKARDIEVLDIKELTSIGDFFIICSCGSTPQVHACCDEVEEKLEEIDVKCIHKEGYSGGSWVLMDYGDVIVHIMQDETRKFYSLERLWDDCPRLDVKID